MLIGFMNNPWRPLEEELKFISENFDFAEITIEYPEASPEKILSKKNRIESLINKNNLRVLAHAPWYFHLGHPYDRIRQCYISEMMDIINVAGQIGAECVTIHSEISEGLPSKYLQDMKEELLEKFSMSLDMIKDKVDEFGMKLMLENLDGKAITLDEIFLLLNSRDIKITFDIAHAFIELHGDNNKLIDYLIKLRDKIEHMHFSDNFGNKDMHLPLGVGAIDWDKILHKAMELGFDRTITLEVHAKDRDYVLLSKEKVLREVERKRLI